MGRKKSGDGDCPMIPGWLVTYGDLMSLLLVFFILLQSFSTIQDSDFKKAIGSILIALGLQPLGETMIVTPMVGKNGIGKASATSDSESENEEMMEDIQQEINAMLKDSLNKDLAESIKMQVTKKGLQISISDSVIFSSGSAALQEKFKIVLTAIGKVVAPRMDKYEMVVEGHTDNQPINTAQFPSNWELSVNRALAVLKFMLNKSKLPPDKVTAVGYGEYRPVNDNLTPLNRSKNRRVEIYLNSIPPKVAVYKGDNKNSTDSLLKNSEIKPNSPQ